MTFIIEKLGSAHSEIIFGIRIRIVKKLLIGQGRSGKDYADPETVRQKTTDSYPGGFCIVCKTKHCRTGKYCI